MKTNDPNRSELMEIKTGTIRAVVRDWQKAGKPSTLPPVNGFMVMPSTGTFAGIAGGDVIEIVLLEGGEAYWRIVTTGALKHDHPSRIGADDGMDHAGRDFNALYVDGVLGQACFPEAAEGGHG